MSGPKQKGPSQEELDLQAKQRQQLEDQNRTLKEEADSAAAIRRSRMFGLAGLMNQDTGAVGVQDKKQKNLG